MSRVVKPRVGYTDLLHWPEDGRRYEISDGEVFVVPSPLPLHQIVADRVARLLDEYARRHGGIAITAPLDIVFTEYDVLQPDVVFFSAARRHLINLHEPIRHAPDLVVEVLSPSTAGRDRGAKLQTYAQHGVVEYWIIEPDVPSLELLALNGRAFVLAQTCGREDLVSSPLLPDVRFLFGAVIPAN